MKSRWLPQALTLGTISLSLACADGPRTPGGTVEWDSAGVSIVEIPRNAWDQLEEWSLAAEPSLEIGVVDGSPEYQFYRIGAVLRTGDGWFVVADRGSDEIRFFDREGQHIRSVGGQGEGPGEFENLLHLGRYGADSLLAWDGELRRATILDKTGGMGRTYSAPDIGGAFLYGMVIPGDGSVIGRLDQGYSPDEVPPGVQRHTTTFLRLAPTGDTATIAGLFGNESLVAVLDGRRVGMRLPFGHAAAYAGAPWGFIYGSTFDYEIQVYRLEGGLSRIIRTDRPAPELMDYQVDSFLTAGQERASNAEERREFMDSYADAPFPQTLPTYSALLAGTDSTIWAAEYSTNRDAAKQWFVFGQDGRIKGRVTTPARFIVHEVGRDYVLGVAMDDFDVERVCLYRLRKSRGR